jgi:hypothetical protein
VLDHAGRNTHNHCTARLAPGRNFALLVATNQAGDAGAKACAARKALLDVFLKAH